MTPDLRQALDHFDASEVDYEPYVALETVLDAARCWLRLQEGDEQTIEKMAKAIWRSDTLDVNERQWDSLQDWQRGDYFTQARAVLAAITEEEQK